MLFRIPPPPENATIRAGSVNITASDVVAVSEFIINPGYKTDEAVDDVALLKLATPLTFDERVQPICLATHYEEVPGEEGFVVGYGRFNGMLEEKKLIIWLGKFGTESIPNPREPSTSGNIS